MLAIVILLFVHWYCQLKHVSHSPGLAHTRVLVHGYTSVQGLFRSFPHKTFGREIDTKYVYPGM